MRSSEECVTRFYLHKCKLALGLVKKPSSISISSTLLVSLAQVLTVEIIRARNSFPWTSSTRNTFTCIGRKTQLMHSPSLPTRTCTCLLHIGLAGFKMSLLACCDYGTCLHLCLPSHIFCMRPCNCMYMVYLLHM